MLIFELIVDGVKRGQEKGETMSKYYRLLSQFKGVEIRTKGEK